LSQAEPQLEAIVKATVVRVEVQKVKVNSRKRIAKIEKVISGGGEAPMTSIGHRM